MKRVLPFAIAALLIPGVALAKGPNPNKGTHPNHGKAKVMYVLRGMVYDYKAYDSNTNTPGSITISTGAKTKLLLKNGVTSVAATQPGDLGTVKVRASRLAFKSAMLSDVQNALQDQPAFQIIDKGPASS